MNTNLLPTDNKLSILYDDEKLKDIRKIICKAELTDVEFTCVLEIARSLKLNPLLREIWCVKYGSTAAQIFIGRDGYRKIAQTSPEYEYHQCDAVYENDDFEINDGCVQHKYNLKNRGKLVGGYCIVKRRSAGRHIFVYAEFPEYNTKKSLWQSAAQGGKPATMIKKVAESQCLRMAFQDLFEGTYSEYEEWDSPAELESKGTIFESLPDESVENESSATEDQIHKIDILMEEKQFSEERRQKVLDYYKVEVLAELTQSSAERLLTQLEKVS